MPNLQNGKLFLEYWYCTVRKRDIPTDWVDIDENDSETYPPEGYSVQIMIGDGRCFPVSDKYVCSWLASSEYVWRWNEVNSDECGAFSDNMRPVKWKFI